LKTVNVNEMLISNQTEKKYISHVYVI
jgi:hypothetical protein